MVSKTGNFHLKSGCFQPLSERVLTFRFSVSWVRIAGFGLEGVQLQDFRMQNVGKSAHPSEEILSQCGPNNLNMELIAPRSSYDRATAVKLG